MCQVTDKSCGALFRIFGALLQEITMLFYNTCITGVP